MIELWVEERDGEPAVNRVIAEVVRARGDVRVRVPERELIDPSAELPEAVLLKSATDLSLALAVVVEAAGGRVVNGAAATVRAHDKAASLALLAAVGLPVPETHLVAAGAEPRSNGHCPGEWVGKPVRGVHGAGVFFAPSFAGAAAGAEECRLVQRSVGDGPDLKVYAAGPALFAGRKRFAADSYRNDDIEPVDLDPVTAGIVHAAGETLGLRLFGVDIRLGDEGPAIVDVNPFPGYRGFPQAVTALLAELERAL